MKDFLQRKLSKIMWKIFGEKGVAIVTTFEKLCNSITDSKSIHGSSVIYYNPEKGYAYGGNLLRYPLFKRHVFASEQEFRLIHWMPEIDNSV